MFKTILMATDGSPAVKRLLVFTEHMARRTDAHVVVVHACALPDIYDWTERYGALVAQFRGVAEEAPITATNFCCPPASAGMGAIYRSCA
ncbi:MAG: universal stress protein [Litorilinea sp.]